MSKLLNKLNQEQKEAVSQTQGPLLIVAGAGTGKTTVITRKVAYLIEKGLAKNDEILALTFTDKAAEEMEDRVNDLLGFGYFDLWISTFHKFAQRILSEHGLEIGINSDATLLSEFEQYILMRKNLDKFELDYYQPQGNPTKFIKALLNLISRAKDENISPERYLNYAEELKANLDQIQPRISGKSQKPAPNSAKTKKEGDIDGEVAEEEAQKINEVANAYHVYQNLLKEKGLMDFGDLITYTLHLFNERKSILQKYREKFKYILIDEFQDTNLAQYELIKLLSAPQNNLSVLADDDQSIYAFRGASMSNVLHFQKDYPETKQIFLTQNYRSGQNILDVSYEFIKLNNPNRLEYRINQEGGDLNKKLISQTEYSGEIEVMNCSNFQEEAERIGEKIHDLKEENNANWKDFAILLRANDSAKDIYEYLSEQGFPCLLKTSKGLYKKEIIMDIIAYMRAANDYYDNNAILRVLNMPISKLDLKEISQINYWAGRKSWSIFETLSQINTIKTPLELKRKAQNIKNLIEKHSSIAKWGKPQELMMSFLKDSGYLEYLKQKDEFEIRTNNDLLNAFLERIQKFTSSAREKRVKNFLEEIDMEIEAGEEGDLPESQDAGPDAITIMTAHGSKGGEYKYVFLAGLVDTKFPGRKRTEPIKIPDDLVKEVAPENDNHLEEERRLFYVAMTRAKEYLILSWSRDMGGKQKSKPSRFLIESNLIDKSNAGLKAERKKPGEFDLEINKRGALSPSKEKDQKLPIPEKFSYTQLASYDNCPYQYYLAHILRIPGKGNSAFSFGQTMHNTLQKVFEIIRQKNNLNQDNLFEKKDQDKNKNKISWEEIETIYRECWIDDWYSGKKQKENRWEEGKKSLKEFFELHKDNWPHTTGIEKGFNASIKTDGEIFYIRGKMDRIDRKEEDKIKIIDYKTGKAKEKLDFKGKEQLLLYQMAAEEYLQKNVSSLAFYYIEENKEFEFLGSDKEIEKAREKFQERIKSIRQRKFSPKPGYLCRYCDYKDICEYRK